MKTISGEVLCPLCGEPIRGKIMEHMRSHRINDAIQFMYPSTTHGLNDIALLCCCRFETSFGGLTDAWHEMYEHWSACGDLHATILMMRPET